LHKYKQPLYAAFIFWREYVILIFFVIDFLSSVLAIIFVNWWVPLFARKTLFFNRGVFQIGYKLPSWLCWFDTFDEDLDQGRRDGSITARSIYWSRVQWLNRNSAYGFSYWALGIPFDRGQWRVLKNETGSRLTFFAVDDDGHFAWHATRLGLQFKLGWKAWNNFYPSTGSWSLVPWGPEWRIPFVFSISIA
jgi:hypothetical protein